MGFRVHTTTDPDNWVGFFCSLKTWKNLSKNLIFSLHVSKNCGSFSAVINQKFSERNAMKLIYCPECRQIISLTMEPTGCHCKRSGGLYLNQIFAVYWGDAVPLGIANSSFHAALKDQPDTAPGECFTAFVIEKKCPRFIPVDYGRVAGREDTFLFATDVELAEIEKELKLEGLSE